MLALLVPGTFTVATGVRSYALPRIRDPTRYRAPAPTSVFGSLDTSEARSSALINGACVGTLALIGVSCVVHHDVAAIASLYAQPDYSIPEVTSRFDIATDVLLRLPSDWLAWYDAEALKFPIMTKASTSATCYFVGDILAQTIRGKRIDTLDLLRSTRSAAAGFIGHGPVAHFWLQFVETYLSFDGAWWAVVPKIVFDQGPMSIVYNTVYTLLIGILALRSPEVLMADVRDTWWPAMKASIKFWPIVHLFTFSPFIPVELKLLWIDVMEIIWIAILSQVNARESETSSQA